MKSILFFSLLILSKYSFCQQRTIELSELSNKKTAILYKKFLSDGSFLISNQNNSESFLYNRQGQLVQRFIDSTNYKKKLVNFIEYKFDFNEEFDVKFYRNDNVLEAYKHFLTPKRNFVKVVIPEVNWLYAAEKNPKAGFYKHQNKQKVASSINCIDPNTIRIVEAYLSYNEASHPNINPIDNQIYSFIRILDIDLNNGMISEKFTSKDFISGDLTEMPNLEVKINYISKEEIIFSVFAGTKINRHPTISGWYFWGSYQRFSIKTNNYETIKIGEFEFHNEDESVANMMIHTNEGVRFCYTKEIPNSDYLFSLHLKSYKFLDNGIDSVLYSFPTDVCSKKYGEPMFIQEYLNSENNYEAVIKGNFMIKKRSSAFVPAYVSIDQMGRTTIRPRNFDLIYFDSKSGHEYNLNLENNNEDVDLSKIDFGVNQTNNFSPYEKLITYIQKTDPNTNSYEISIFNEYLDGKLLKYNIILTEFSF